MAQNLITPKQRRFVDEFQVDLNATAAAKRAGYSAKTAKSQGQRLLTNVDVAAAIQAAQFEVIKRTNVTVDDVVTGLLAEAEGKDDSTAGSRVAAWAQLGKHLGMDRKDIQLRIDQPRAEDMTETALESELERVRTELISLMSPAQAKAEMQKIHGELAELEAIANGGGTRSRRPPAEQFRSGSE